MCGIAGIVSWNESFRVSRDLLLAMSAKLAHRGPDGEGIFLSEGTPQCGFAFRRLAILDPSPRSMQPFTIGSQTLVFNGEIYNFRELREEISKLKPEYEWRTTGDTEVLLMSYAVWGDSCVEKLNGLFAFAVWNDADKSLFLARDRMGQLPLYITHTVVGKSAAMAFASEMSALKSLPWFDHGVNARSLTQYLRYGYARDSTAITIFKMTLESRPASVRLDRALPVRSRSYFDCNAPSTASQKSTRDVVRTAVQRQLISDVPLGVFLSGGIDSSVVARCAREVGPVQTFSISFDDSRYDESNYAREVAKHLGTDHHEFRVTPNVIEDLPKLAEVFGEPFADSSVIPTHYLARETRKHVKVALSGDGGDELFGGYERYRAMQLSSRIQNRPLKSFVATVARPWTGGHPKSTFARAARFLGSLDLDEASRYDAYMRIFDDATIRELTDADLQQFPTVSATFKHEMDRLHDPVRAALATDRITYLPNDLLTKVDRACMLHNLEVRAPFMDHELVQFAAGLTTDQLLKGGPKRMLREAFAADLPDFVFKRKKMGFAVPIGEWFRGPLKSFLRDHLFAGDSFAKQHFKMPVVERLIDEHETQRRDHSQRLYALLMLELWWKLQRRP